MMRSWTPLLTLFFIAILLETVFYVHAVDRSKFKRCSQSGFCSRQRNFVKGIFNYSIDPTTVNISGPRLKAIIHEKKTNIDFLLEITRYQDNIVRIKINEKAPLFKRYEVQDVILEEKLQEVPFNRVFQDLQQQQHLLHFGDNDEFLLILDHNNVAFKFFINKEPAITINKRGLFYFEHYRSKQQNISRNSESSPSSETEKPIDDEDDVHAEINDVTTSSDTAHNVTNTVSSSSSSSSLPNIDMSQAWEETFGSHRDSKPRGPSSIGFDVTFHGALHVYGIPEHASTLALKRTRGQTTAAAATDMDPYRLYNLDVFEYELDTTMALYGSVPVMYAHDKKKTTGIFWLNASEMWIDIEDSLSENQEVSGTDTHWMSESGILDVFVLPGPRPYDVLRQYTQLTGTQTLPPYWSIAYHQCRWNYFSEDEVAEVDRGFDTHDIPYDVLWLDIEHTDSKKYFTWNQEKFPHPEEMLRNMSARGKRMVTIIDPHIKRDDTYEIHVEAKTKGFYVKDANGNDFEGSCWPGSSSWLDFLNPAVRDFWAERFRYDKYKGSAENLHTWNDMNEPSVFNGPETTLPKDTKHFGDFEHRDVHNQYGFYLHMATYNGLVNRNPLRDKRPFVLSRAFFAGSQRYGAVWTGDNLADWSHLRDSFSMLLSLSLAGISFCGADVGGFFKDPNATLITRWYQAAAFYPFFRNHAHIDTKRREPWVFGEPYLTYMRNAIRMRYVLLPYWYTLFYHAHTRGLPPLRPIWIEYPEDERTFAMQDQFLVGPDLLVKPVTTQNQSLTEVYLPGNQNSLWYDYETHLSYAGGQTVTIETPLDRIPVFVRGGAILPLQERLRRATTQMISDPYTLFVALDSNLEASGEFYIDDGITFAYEKGTFLRRSFIYHVDSANHHSLKCSPIGNEKMYFRNKLERVVVLGLPKRPSAISLTLSKDEKHSSKGPTPLDFEWTEENKQLTIRRPDVVFTTSWTIDITFE